MKKTWLLSVILCLSLTLVGCSAISINTAAAAIGNGAVETTASEQYSLALQLALGTLKLEGTEYPVDAEQSATLLPLWKAARGLSMDDMASELEMVALVDQIHGSMTSQQWKAIQSMGISAQELPALVQELGVQIDSVGQPANLVPSSDASAKVTAQSGQSYAGGGMPGDGGALPDGGVPVDGGGPPSGNSGDQSSQSSQTQSSGSGSFLGLNQTLLDAVIKFLEAKL